jgi:hypothetical protein
MRCYCVLSLAFVLGVSVFPQTDDGLSTSLEPATNSETSSEPTDITTTTTDSTPTMGTGNPTPENNAEPAIAILKSVSRGDTALTMETSTPTMTRLSFIAGAASCVQRCLSKGAVDSGCDDRFLLVV